MWVFVFKLGCSKRGKRVGKGWPGNEGCSPTLSRTLHARVYPSDYVFLLSHLSHEGKKEMEKGKKWGAEDSEKRVFWELTTSRTRTVTEIVCQNPPNAIFNRLNYNWLHQTVTDVTVKKHKTLVYTRMRAHVKEIIIVNFIYTISLFVVTLFLTIC